MFARRSLGLGFTRIGLPGGMCVCVGGGNSPNADSCHCPGVRFSNLHFKGFSRLQG